MNPKIHRLVGTFAMLTITLFLAATLVAETLLDRQAVAAVKQAIVWGLLVLVPALAATGASGVALAKRRGGRLVDVKRRRMAIVAANGLLVMLPSALFLHFKASAGAFDGAFAAVQALELLGGAVQLTLLGLNLRDGLRLAGRLPGLPPQENAAHRTSPFSS